jgi:hypothetical protein
MRPSKITDTGKIDTEYIKISNVIECMIKT